jgi:hypothetical protein
MKIPSEEKARYFKHLSCVLSMDVFNESCPDMRAKLREKADDASALAKTYSLMCDVENKKDYLR